MTSNTGILLLLLIFYILGYGTGVAISFIVGKEYED